MWKEWGSNEIEIQQEKRKHVRLCQLYLDRRKARRKSFFSRLSAGSSKSIIPRISDTMLLSNNSAGLRLCDVKHW